MTTNINSTTELTNNITKGKQLKLISFIKLSRLKFLIYSALSYTFGTTLCLYADIAKISLNNYIFGLLSVWFIHLMTHYCNEFYDLKADKVNLSFTKWTGGSRVLVNKELSPNTSISAGYLVLFITIFLSFFSPNKGSTLIIYGGLFFGWFYTAPPLSFNYRGLGEISVAITLVYLVPLMGFIVQSGAIYLPIIFILLPSFFVQFTRMMIMNLSDYEGDVIANKGTLVTILRPKRTISVYGMGHILAYSLLIVLYFYGYIPVYLVLTTLCTLPISIWQYIRIKKGGYKDKKTANSIVFWASTHSALLILAAYLGVVLDMWSNNYYKTGRNPNLLVLCTIPPAVYLILMCKQVLKNR